MAKKINPRTQKAIERIHELNGRIEQLKAKKDSMRLSRQDIVDLKKLGDPKSIKIAEYAETGLSQEEIPFITPHGEEMTKEELIRTGIKENRLPKEMPNRLPTMGLNPFLPDEHKMIGMFESKQTIYLLLAHAYNRLMERVEKLEKKLDNE